MHQHQTHTTRILFTQSGELLQDNSYYPFGMLMSGLDYGAGTSPENKYLYNGKELQDDFELDWYDYGARMYDPILGQWHSPDIVTESYCSWSPYNYAKNNPILRIDPNGMWDVTVHVYNDRAQFSYGIAIVTDRHGKEVTRYLVRVKGQHRNRMEENGDSPTGTYDIPNKFKDMWMSGGSEASYGPNDRLIIIPESGEAKESGRNLFRAHGGRQRENDYKQEPEEPLQPTNGCFRMFDDDIADLRKRVENMMKNDEEEFGGKWTVIDDLKKPGEKIDDKEQKRIDEDWFNGFQNRLNGYFY